MEYMNSEEQLKLKEYGRNVQKLVKYICTIEDRQKRTDYAYALIHLMKQLNPSVKENSGDNLQRIWDHLYIMSDFELDIDSPFPKPSPDILISKPQKMEYNNNTLRYKHYGRNIELLISNALALESEEEQEEAAMFIGKLMKTFYSAWNKESMEDLLIVQQLYEMSGRKLDLRRRLKEANGNLFATSEKQGSNRDNSNNPKPQGSQSGSSSGKPRRSRRKRN